MNKLYCIAFLIFLFSCGGETSVTSTLGSACNNDNGTAVVCEEGSLSLICNGTIFEEAGPIAFDPQVGCVTTLCTNPNGQGVIETVCAAE